MKTKPNASIILVAIIASVIVLTPIVKQAMVTIYQWLAPLVKAHVKAQAGEEVIEATVTSIEKTKAVILKVDSTLLMVKETAKQVYVHTFYLPTLTELYSHSKTAYFRAAAITFSPLYLLVLQTLSQ